MSGGSFITRKVGLVLGVLLLVWMGVKYRNWSQNRPRAILPGEEVKTGPVTSPPIVPATPTPEAASNVPAPSPDPTTTALPPSNSEASSTPAPTEIPAAAFPAVKGLNGESVSSPGRVAPRIVNTPPPATVPLPPPPVNTSPRKAEELTPQDRIADMQEVAQQIMPMLHSRFGEKVKDALEITAEYLSDPPAAEKGMTAEDLGIAKEVLRQTEAFHNSRPQ
jgi:hypothetical protein